jgi:hypothetical protein
MAGVVGVIWGDREEEYFCGRDWTTQIALIGLMKSAFWRSTLWDELRGRTRVHRANGRRVTHVTAHRRAGGHGGVHDRAGLELETPP